MILSGSATLSIAYQPEFPRLFICSSEELANRLSLLPNPTTRLEMAIPKNVLIVGGGVFGCQLTRFPCLSLCTVAYLVLICMTLRLPSPFSFATYRIAIDHTIRKENLSSSTSSTANPIRTPPTNHRTQYPPRSPYPDDTQEPRSHSSKPPPQSPTLMARPSTPHASSAPTTPTPPTPS